MMMSEEEEIEDELGGWCVCVCEGCVYARAIIAVALQKERGCVQRGRVVALTFCVLTFDRLGTGNNV